MSSAPLLVGITGGIGAGKSVVCQIFSHLGIPVYDADSSARKLMVSDELLMSSIKETFGDESYLPTGALNREYLSGRVFSNPDELNKLNALVHPRVGEDFKKWVEGHLEAPYLIKEAALLIESGSYKELDKLVAVLADKATRVRRVMLRDVHRSEVAVNAIIDKQLSDSAFRKHADHVILNEESNPILPKVLKLHQEFLALAGQR